MSTGFVLFSGQIQRPQKVPHSKPLVQATHLVSKCRRRKKGGTTPEICQDPWLGLWDLSVVVYYVSWLGFHRQLPCRAHEVIAH